MYKGHVGESIYTIENEEICSGENKNDEESFFKEYNNKLKNLYNKFYTEEAKEMALKHKEYALYFYDKLLRQIAETYNSKELLERYIRE